MNVTVVLPGAEAPKGLRKLSFIERVHLLGTHANRANQAYYKYQYT